GGGRSHDEHDGGERARQGEHADRTMHGRNSFGRRSRSPSRGPAVYGGGARPPRTSRSVNAGTPSGRGSSTRDPRGGVGDDTPRIRAAASAARRTKLITAATSIPTASWATAPTGRTRVRSCMVAGPAIRPTT